VAFYGQISPYKAQVIEVIDSTVGESQIVEYKVADLESVSWTLLPIELTSFKYTPIANAKSGNKQSLSKITYYFIFSILLDARYPHFWTHQFFSRATKIPSSNI
jgi:hypothetical protein